MAQFLYIKVVVVPYTVRLWIHDTAIRQGFTERSEVAWLMGLLIL